MNDEIKEILDWLKDFNRDRPFGMSIYDRKILSDYITNLQQENFNLRENILIHKMSFKSDDKSLEHLITMPSYEELQQENERLKEELKYTIPDVQHNQIVTKLAKEKNDYKSRLEKAIDKLTIKQARFINEKDYVLDDNDLDEIMYILQNGSDDNE